MNRKFYAVIEFRAPKEATHLDIKEFFQELCCAGGSMSPEDPMFDSFSSVKVATLRRMKL